MQLFIRRFVPFCTNFARIFTILLFRVHFMGRPISKVNFYFAVCYQNAYMTFACICVRPGPLYALWATCNGSFHSFAPLSNRFNVNGTQVECVALAFMPIPQTTFPPLHNLGPFNRGRNLFAHSATIYDVP